jgi:hypothetical protein
MKKQTKTINQNGAVKTPRPKRAGKLLSLGLGVATVFTPLAATGCKMETEYVDVPVPTYPEITIPIRFFNETMDVTCPGNLMDESYTKLNDVMLLIETALNGEPAKNSNINLLHNNDVKIIVKNDGSVANCEKTGPFAMTINYQWLLASSNGDIGDAMLSVFAEMMSEMAKAKGILFDYKKNTVYITLAKAVIERKSACHRFC